MGDGSDSRFDVSTSMDPVWPLVSLVESRGLLRCPSSGLQLSRTKRAARAGRSFDPIDDEFIPKTTALLRRHQPVAFAFLCILASPKDTSSPLWGRGPAKDGSRPPDLVSTMVILQ